MPYVITTRREGRQPGRDHDAAWSRRAVATLEEAHRLVGKTIVDSAFEYGTTRGYPGPLPVEWASENITESGGTVGPLPDGTVIEVEPGPGQQDMRQALREWGVSMDTRDALDDTIVFAWVEHFNAKQAV